MSRASEFKNENPNPAQRFLEWKSENKCFQFYDKEAQQRVDVKLPFKFLTLKEMHTVKGWSDSSESAIFANEVKFIGTEPLNVRSFKGGEIAKGLYKDIKSRVKDFGGHYVKSIYIMTEDGEIWNISLKGSAVQSWGDFTQKSRSRLSDEWVVVEDAEERKKGSIKYTVPVFKYQTSLSKDEGTKADQVYATLKMYMDTYQAANVQVEEMESGQTRELPPEEVYADEVSTSGSNDDDLPF